MNHFLLIINQFKPGSEKIAEDIEAYLKDKGKDVETVLMNNRLPDINDETGKCAECALVLGGDGTILRSAYKLVQKDIPILGINMGHVGYLADVDADNFKEALDCLINDTYVSEKRMMLQGRILRGGEEIYSTHALNDIVITRNGDLQVVDFDVWVNNRPLKSYSADGVIISTPTGSTAYNLSAGGPIVEPGANLIILTPLAPHTMMNRSIILKSDDLVEIRINEPHDVEMKQFIGANFDGNSKIDVQAGDIIEVTKTEKTVTLISLNEKNFVETLYQKMREI